MDIVNFTGKASSFLKKHKYSMLILIIGISLMLVPNTRKEQTADKEESAAIQPESDINKQLADILSQIDGVGNVQVLLTEGAGEETIYQLDNDMSASEESKTNQTTTVLVTNAEKNQTGLVRQVLPVKYLGALIVCQGADSPSVQLAIVEAVAKVTGLGTDRISVLKMK